MHEDFGEFEKRESVVGGRGGGGSQNCKLALLIMNKMVDCIIILEDS